jgi:hypothetical protein
VHGDGHAFVLARDSPHLFGEMGLRLSKGQSGRHGQEYDQNPDRRHQRDDRNFSPPCGSGLTADAVSVGVEPVGVNSGAPQSHGFPDAATVKVVRASVP